MRTPVFGSATAETSAMGRLVPPPVCAQLDSVVWNLAAFRNALQPLPAPDQTVSEARWLAPSRFRLVPPTAITLGSAAGYCAPKPESPVEAVMATKGCLNADDPPESSPPP